MKTIEKEFLSTLKTQTKKFSQDESLKDLEKSLVSFDDMVKKGLVKKRGYNLQSIEDAHKPSMCYNLNC
jgi:ribosomal protein S20